MAMTDQQLREIQDGSQALCDWFASQETSPQIAGAIMANVVAGLMIAKTTDKEKLADLYEQFGKLLLGVIEIRRQHRLNGDNN